jgi:hypothetical protein
MIPDIGIMVAAYIVTRMVTLLGPPSSQANFVAKAFSVVTIVITLFCTLDLLVHGVTVPAAPLR